MVAIDITIKNLKDIFRNFRQNAIVFFLPIVFMGVFAFVFGKNTGDLVLPVAYVENENAMYQDMLKILKDLNSGNTEKKTFEFTSFDKKDAAIESLRQNDTVLLIEWKEPLGLLLSGDPTNQYYGASVGVVTSVTAPMFNIDTSLIETRNISMPASSDINGFDILVPGLIVYGILMMVPYVAGSLAEIVEKKEIFRYFTSKVTATDILLGLLGSQLIISLIQTFISVGAAMVFGFDPQGNILLIIPLALLTNIFAVGTGLLIGTFSRDSQTASNTGSMVSVVLGFLSGSFIVGIGSLMKIGTIAGREVKLTDIFPSAHATEAMRQILLYDKGLGDLTFEFAALAVSSVIVLFVGIIAYRKFQMRHLGGM